MLRESDAKRESLPSRFRKSTMAQLAVAYAMAAVWYFGISTWSRLSDCGPHESDGQCGMSTAFGKIAGITGALVIAGMCSLQALLLAQARRRNREKVLRGKLP